MRKLASFSVLCVLLTIQAFSQKPPHRDLTKYDDGGTVDFSWGRMAEFSFLAARLRDFVWTHFNERHRGRITRKFYSIEGDPSIQNIFIEPTPGGNWQIVIEAEYSCCWWYGMQKPRKKRTVRRENSVFLTAERIEAEYRQTDRHPTTTGKSIKTEEQVPANKYRLLLKDQTGLAGSDMEL